MSIGVSAIPVQSFQPTACAIRNISKAGRYRLQSASGTILFPAALRRSALRRYLMADAVHPRPSGTATDGAASPSPPQDFLVQYVVVRKDLWTELKWPLGSVVAQACHASTAAMWLHKDDDATQQYLSADNIDCMRKVVLEVKDEAALRKLAAALVEGGVKHKLWVEQPEDFPTCLATRPYPKSEVAQYFKKFQLSKAPVG